MISRSCSDCIATGVAGACTHLMTEASGACPQPSPIRGVWLSCSKGWHQHDLQIKEGFVEECTLSYARHSEQLWMKKRRVREESSTG